MRTKFAQADQRLMPMVLDLRDKLVVCVGGGKVTARRARTFLDAGAEVKIISPSLSQDLALLIGDKLEWIPKCFSFGDLRGAWLAHTATGDPEVDKAVREEAHLRTVFCVNAAQAEAGNARVPARARLDTQSGVVHVAVSSNDPRRSQAIARHVQRDLTTGRAPTSAFRATPTPGMETQ